MIQEYLGRISVNSTKQQWKYGDGMFLIVHEHFQGYINQSFMGYIQFSSYSPPNSNDSDLVMTNLINGFSSVSFYYNPFKHQIWLNNSTGYGVHIFKFKKLF